VKIEPKRHARYRQKINYILSALEEIGQRPSEPQGLLLRGMFYNMVTAIESAMDIGAMLVRHLGEVPVDDRHNIRILIERGLLDEQLGTNLLRCNALRDVLVHKYNGIDDERVLESISEVDSILRAYIRTVGEIIGGP